MHIIGLTGSIASGKSTATNTFRNAGISVIDCDAIVHDVQGTNVDLILKLKNRFPTAFAKGSLDRAVLSNLVIADPALLSEIQNMTLPYVRTEIDHLTEHYKNTQTPLLVIDAPLLFESGLDKICDSTICLYVSPEVQKARYLARPNATEEKFNMIIARQMPVEEKKKRATYKVISDNLENLSNQLMAITHTLNHPIPNHTAQIGFYAGSFDPLTLGHWNLICDAICRCDKVYVGIGINPDKKPLFSTEEKRDIIHKTVSDFMTSYHYRTITGYSFSETEKKAYAKLQANPTVVEPLAYTGLTIDAALRVGATVLLRGERNSGDHDYEAAITTINQNLLKVRNRDLGAMTLTPFNQAASAHISSSSVRMLCKAGEYIAAEDYVSPTTHNRLMAKTLYPIFEKASLELGQTDTHVIQSEYQILAQKYSFNRAYHNLSHIAAGLNYLNIYETLEHPLSDADKQALVMALFYHDFSQEENGISLSNQAMRRYLQCTPRRARTEISGLIRATDHMKNKTLTPQQKIMSDLDLSILGSPNRYLAYTRKIREEYANFSDMEFAAGRLKILDGLMAKRPLYHTDFFHQMFEQSARDNIATEQILCQAVCDREKHR